MELQEHPLGRLAVFVGHLVLAVGLAEEGQRGPVGPGRRLDDVRHVALLGQVVEVGQVLAAAAVAGACPRRRARRPARRPGGRACPPCGCAGRNRRDGPRPPARRTRPAAGRERRIRCRPCRRSSGSAPRARGRAAAAARPPGPGPGTSGSGGRANTGTTAGELAGWQKNSISICSNSRERKVKFRGVISLRKLLPTWAMPKGIRTRVLSSTFLKLTKMPWAVSGRRKAASSSPPSAPTIVLNIRLNSRGSVSVPSVLASGPSTAAKSAAATVVQRDQLALPVQLVGVLGAEVEELQGLLLASPRGPRRPPASVATKTRCPLASTQRPCTWS